MPLLTVVIPTFNRTEKLFRLIGFLQRTSLDLSIVVLDSSRTAERNKNAQTCKYHNVKHICFDPAIQFYDKLAIGLRKHVDTPLACLCADDDIILPEALNEAAQALINDEQIAVAHGAYAQFTMQGGLRLTNIVYSRRGITADRSIDRVAECLMQYEATIYGVHRSKTLLKILDEAKGAPSLFASELLTAVLVYQEGNSLRLKNFTHARSISTSHKSFHWHPAELMACNPEHLLEAFQFVLQRLKHYSDKLSLADERLFHLATIAYLSDYIDREATRRITKKAMGGATMDELSELGLNESATLLQKNSLSAIIRRSAPVRELKRLLSRHEGLYEFIVRRWRSGLSGGKTIRLETTGNYAAKVTMEPSFLRKLSDLDLKPDNRQVYELITALSLYSRGATNGSCQKSG